MGAIQPLGLHSFTSEQQAPAAEAGEAAGTSGQGSTEAEVRRQGVGQTVSEDRRPDLDRQPTKSERRRATESQGRSMTVPMSSTPSAGRPSIAATEILARVWVEVPFDEVAWPCLEYGEAPFADAQVDVPYVEDIGEAVRFLLKTSPNCHVPELVFNRPSEGLDTP